MTRTSEPKGRPAFWGVALAALLLAGAMIASLGGKPTQTTDTKKPAPETVAASKAEPAPAQAGAQAPDQPAAQEPVTGTGMQAFKDPVTGQIGAPTAEQAAELNEKIKAEAAAQKLRSKQAGTQAAVSAESAVPGGGVEMVLDDSALTYTVATKGPDGKVRIEHATGAAEANAKTKANSQKPQQKEERNDR